jgi:ADP-heptose:LPS heptosyltransferase
MENIDIYKKGIKFAFLPVEIRLILRDLLLFLNYLNMQFANLFIRPLKRKEAEKLKDEIEKGTIKRVLINRQDLIGDAVISLKIIDKLKPYFDEVYILVSDNNSFIFDELSGVKKVKLNKIINSDMKFDLIIDLIGTLATDKKIKSRYKIGMNRGFFSILYSNFYLWNLTESKMQVVEFYKELIKYTLGIQLEIDDLPPSDFRKEKKDQIFIFVGNKSNRNLLYEKWKELILLSANNNKTIIADDPDQRIMNKLSQDKEIIENKNIELIVGPKQLKDLVKIANDSKLFIALDGGAEHYLERYTNSITIYTCIDQTGWHPYTLKEWNYYIIGDHVLGQSETSVGLKKYVFYKLKDRKPCYDLVCDYKKFKEINFNLLKSMFYF